VRKADNLPPYCAVVKKSGSLNFLDPSGPIMGELLALMLSRENVAVCCEIHTQHIMAM
jgi:hypothetical protein